MNMTTRIVTGKHGEWYLSNSRYIVNRFYNQVINGGEKGVGAGPPRKRLTGAFARRRLFVSESYPNPEVGLCPAGHAVYRSVLTAL